MKVFLGVCFLTVEAVALSEREGFVAPDQKDCDNDVLFGSLAEERTTLDDLYSRLYESGEEEDLQIVQELSSCCEARNVNRNAPRTRK